MHDPRMNEMHTGGRYCLAISKIHSKERNLVQDRYKLDYGDFTDGGYVCLASD